MCKIPNIHAMRHARRPVFSPCGFPRRTLEVAVGLVLAVNHRQVERGVALLVFHVHVHVQPVHLREKVEGGARDLTDPEGDTEGS